MMQLGSGDGNGIVKSREFTPIRKQGNPTNAPGILISRWIVSRAVV